MGTRREIDPDDVFGPAARRFADRHLLPGVVHGDPADRLVALRDAIARWLSPPSRGEPPPDGEAERRFVEGAGAWLALVLADLDGAAARVLRGDDGSVRLGLGRAGAFDPFSAIEEVLDDPDLGPSSALRRVVRRAEEEAAGRGPVARAALAFEAALHRERPGRSIARFEGTLLTLDDATEVDLGGVLVATAGEPEGRRAAAIGRLVAALPGSAGATVEPWGDVRRRVVPRLVGPALVRELGDRAEALHRVPLPFAAPAEVAFLVLARGRGRFVRTSDLPAWGADSEALLARALSNLEMLSGRVRLIRAPVDGGELQVVRSGDALDAARLLLPSFRTGLAGALGGPDRLLVAIPHRDVVLAAAGDAPASVVAALAARARADHDAAPHRIAPDVFPVPAR